MEKHKTKIFKKEHNPRVLESFMLVNGKKGEHFFSSKKDSYLTMLAHVYNRKIQTERYVCVKAWHKEPTAYAITKITLLD